MMDDAHVREVEQDLEKLRNALIGYNYTIINQQYMLQQYDQDGNITQLDECELVNIELGLLKKADLHIVDFVFQPYFYIGCVCELVYSHLFKIPSILIVSDKKIAKRPWLKFHSNITVSGYDHIADAISQLKFVEDK